MTRQDREDFEAFCRQATNDQIRNIYLKERDSRRQDYAAIARSVMAERGLFNDNLIERRTK